MAFTFVMQNIAANLGGMLTPFGNPQNLYLYTKFEIPTLEFMRIMAPPFLISIAIITVCCLFVRPEPLRLEGAPVNLPAGRTALLSESRETGWHHTLRSFLPLSLKNRRSDTMEVSVKIVE